MQFNWHDRRKKEDGRVLSVLSYVCHVIAEERERRCVRVYEWEHLKGEETRAHTDKSDSGDGGVSRNGDSGLAHDAKER